MLKTGDLIINRKGEKGIVIGKDIIYEDRSFSHLSLYNGYDSNTGVKSYDIMKVYELKNVTASLDWDIENRTLKYEREPEFKPYMILGTKTKLDLGVPIKGTDSLGQNLYTGDVVEVYNDGKNVFERVIESQKYYDINMQEYSLRKVKSFEEIKNNEKINFITYVKEDPSIAWKPSEDEEYYIPRVDWYKKYEFCVWDDSESDKLAYKRGIVCKTSEKAIEMTDKMLDIIKEE